MKKFGKLLAIILSSAIIIGVAFGCGYFVCKKQLSESEIVENPTDESNLKLPGEVEKRIVTVEEINSKLKEISEFSTYESEYEVTKSADYSRYFLDDIPVPGTTNTVTLKCKGVVKVGYNLTEINPVVDQESNIISLL